MACDNRGVRFAFYGRTARTDAADTDAERHWQQRCCRAAAAARGGQITACFFGTACPAGMPMASRPHGRALLAALTGPRRRIDAVVTWDAARLLPRQPGPDASVPGWPGAWHTPLLLAGAGITISSPQDHGLITGILLGPGGPPRREQALPAAVTSRTASRRMAGRWAGTARRPR
jgi:hypothetical protein